ncbi:unnamed protein product [Gongylonema pulchrum]|nr:unnamed protein product [Gongylonema pulchrum]
MRLFLIAATGAAIFISTAPRDVAGQESATERTAVAAAGAAGETGAPVCNINEIFNGRTCKCAPG